MITEAKTPPPISKAIGLVVNPGEDPEEVKRKWEEKLNAKK